MTRILGIDPGLADTGIGVIETDGTRWHHLHHECIHTTSGLAMGVRLQAIYEAVVAVIRRYEPQQAGIETLFFARNTTSALPVAQARGVVMLALQQHGVVIGEYNPQAIKQALVGYGKAEKQQVQHMVRVLLGLKAIPSSNHAADALAAAICHANTAVFLSAAGGTIR
ncbi:MAG: crossover junction endodeoxyribonuclease RuvC [Spirochaetaceae bacterium]|nr:MAG: crossover junction endodeoxyribonuclease RuvC [Spirochaetaceae bacterium]